MVFYDFDEIKKRISIEDILLDCGFQTTKNRMPCPLHNGTNPTSLSFTDQVYYCFSCGATGGLLDLAEALFGYNRQEALKYLANKSGISLNNYSLNKRSKQKHTRCKKTIPKQFAPLKNLHLEYKILNILRNHYTWQTKIARMGLENRTIEMRRYYSITQYAEYALEELDSEVISINYEINSEKRRLRNSSKFQVRK